MISTRTSCWPLFAVLVAAMLLVPGLATVGGGRALAQDITIDCSDPANASDPACDPSSTFTNFSAPNVGATVSWSASATCTGPQSGSGSCANNNSSLNGPVPNGYVIEVWGNHAEEGATTCSTDPPGLYQFGKLPAQPEFDSGARASTTSGTASNSFNLPSGGTWYLFPRHESQGGLGGNGNNWGTVNGDTPTGGSWCVSITLPLCGNGIVEAGEQCDPPGLPLPPTGYTCNAQCQLVAPEEVCGDGLVNGSEQCDDGNTNDGDACSNSCTWNPETCTISTEIHFPDDSPTGPSVTMGATVHDSATVSCYYPDGVTVAPIPNPSTADFNYFTNGSCDGLATDTSNGHDVSGGSVDPVLTEGPLTVGSVSYNAHFSGGTDIHGLPVAAADSACEKLDVLSSITDFYYTVPNDTTQYNCTVEMKAANGGVCPADTQEACLVLGQQLHATVHVGVTDDTGGSILEYVQGGLAALKKSQDYYVPSTGVIATNSCASDPNNVAIINRSSAVSGGGNKNGNVVTWWDGTFTSTGAPTDNTHGFAMTQGQSCSLTVGVNKTYTSLGEQPVTSSWSENQVGPGTFSGKSPYTGQLSVNVKSTCP